MPVRLSIFGPFSSSPSLQRQHEPDVQLSMRMEAERFFETSEQALPHRVLLLSFEGNSLVCLISTLPHSTPRMNQSVVVFGLLTQTPRGMAWLAVSGNLTNVAMIKLRILCLYGFIEFVC